MSRQEATAEIIKRIDTLKEDHEAHMFAVPGDLREDMRHKGHIHGLVEALMIMNRGTN